MLSALAAGPAAHRKRIEGITANSVMYFLILFTVFSGISVRSSVIKPINLSIVSGQSSLLLSSSIHREYVLLYINSATSFLNILPLLLRFITIGLSPYIRLFLKFRKVILKQLLLVLFFDNYELFVRRAHLFHLVIHLFFYLFLL